MSRWNDSKQRTFLYRVLVKSRVELERRAGLGARAKRAAALAGRGNLSWLAAVYGSDKGATAHRYVDYYEQHLGASRRRATKVLEIGIYRGASLQMWRDYFPAADIYGLDINDVQVDGPRIHTIRGDQSDPELLAQLRDLGPFDMVVDDGSHLAAHISATFDGLFTSVRPGGFYVIEDMQTAYMHQYGGGPPGHDGTSVMLVQQLVDAVNRRHVEESYPGAAAKLPHVEALHVYPRIAFVQRARHEEG